jgi:ubiquinone/menaquinone biosynthesis C-methylase UbiE
VKEGHFDPKIAPVLDSEERLKELRPYELLKDKGSVKPGMICIDLGSGTGTFTFPLLLCVGDKGAVYAVDDSDEMQEYIRSKNPPPNLIFVHSDVLRTGLDDGIADFCLLASILHEVDQPTDLLAEAFRLLKPGGRILDLDWKAELDSPGPPQKRRLSRDRVERLLRQVGFNTLEYFDWSRNYYVVLADKIEAVCPKDSQT